MATFNKINDFVKDLAHGVHDFSSHSLILALSNTAPASETSDPSADGNGVLANVTQVSYTNLSSRALTISSSSQTSGVYSLVLNDITLSASGGAVAGFRYIYTYNDNPTSPADPLIGYYDYGSTLVLADTESLDIDFGADGGTTGTLFTLT